MNKPKFNPIVTRVKLNPEQAVLACSCYNNAVSSRNATRNNQSNICNVNVCRNNFCSANNTGRTSST